MENVPFEPPTEDTLEVIRRVMGETDQPSSPQAPALPPVFKAVPDRDATATFSAADVAEAEGRNDDRIEKMVYGGFDAVGKKADDTAEWIVSKITRRPSDAPSADKREQGLSQTERHTVPRASVPRSTSQPKPARRTKPNQTSRRRNSQEQRTNWRLRSLVGVVAVGLAAVGYGAVKLNSKPAPSNVSVASRPVKANKQPITSSETTSTSTTATATSTATTSAPATTTSTAAAHPAETTTVITPVAPPAPVATVEQAPTATTVAPISASTLRKAARVHNPGGAASLKPKSTKKHHSPSGGVSIAHSTRARTSNSTNQAPIILRSGDIKHWADPKVPTYYTQGKKCTEIWRANGTVHVRNVPLSTPGCK